MGINRAAKIMYDQADVGSARDGLSISKAITDAFTVTASEGLEQQIAIVEVMNSMNPLEDEYSFLNKGNLEFGMGEQYIFTRLKKSEKFDPASNNFVPTTRSDLDKISSTITNKIERQVKNDYTPQEMKEYVKNSDTFAKLINLEASAAKKTQIVEQREWFRYILGIDNGFVDGEVKTLLDTVKSAFNNHTKEITGKDILEQVKNFKLFIKQVQKNPSDKWNIGSKTDGGNIDISSDTSVKPLLNTWSKSEMICITSEKFKADLETALGDKYNPSYWEDFSGMFSKFITDTLTEKSGEYTFYVFHPDVIGFKDLYEEYTNTYYPDNRTFHSLLTYGKHITFIPFLNGLKITLKVA